MARINRDALVAILLMAVSAGAFWKTFEIQVRDDGVMHATVWPRAILALLAVLSVIYFLQSVRTENAAAAPDAAQAPTAELASWFAHYANPLWCLGLYLVFLVTLPWLGMLIGGVLLVFMMLNILGGFSPRSMFIHALIAIGSIGIMWAIFTYALRVVLPDGELLPLLLPR